MVLFLLLRFATVCNHCYHCLYCLRILTVPPFSDCNDMIFLSFVGCFCFFYFPPTDLTQMGLINHSEPTPARVAAAYDGWSRPTQPGGMFTHVRSARCSEENRDSRRQITRPSYRSWFLESGNHGNRNRALEGRRRRLPSTYYYYYTPGIINSARAGKNSWLIAHKLIIWVSVFECWKHFISLYIQLRYR